MELFGALGLDIKILIAQFVNFAVLFFVLHKFGYGPIFEFLEKRKKGIEDGLNKARKADSKLAEMEEKEREVLVNAKKESNDIIFKAEELAKKNKEQILNEARLEAEKIMVDAKKKIEDEREAMVRSVKGEVAGLVMSATEKIIKQKVDGVVDASLIKEAVEQVSI